jgi:LuxR family maltose regulon positive regulatory protein
MLERSNARATEQWIKAGDYFYQKNEYFRSVKYYLKGKNDAGVAKSLYCMYDYNSPYASIEDTLDTIHSSVSDSIVKKFPYLLETQIWAAYVEGNSDSFETLLDKYYKLFPKIVIQNPRSVVNLALLRSIDYRESFIKTMKTLNKIPFKGKFKAASPSITQNLPHAHRSSRDFSELSLDMDKSIELFKKSIGEIIDEIGIINECFYAGFYYERGELNAAHEHALAALAQISDKCSAEIRFCAMMIFAAVLYASGQNKDADTAVENIKEMIEQNSAYYLSANLKAYIFKLQFADGSKDSANEWLKEQNDGLPLNLSLFKIYQYFTTARAYIVTGDYNKAIPLLQKLLQLSERYRRTLDIIESCILLAIVYWKKGRGGNSVALEYLERAVITAHGYNYTQLFSNDGAELVNMLYKLQKRSVQPKHSGSLSAGFVKTLYVAAVEGSKRSRGLTGGRTPENLTFTDKQKIVMRFMCEGLNRNEIAEKTGLKPNTVKSHTELIYKKLDVSNSVDAILKIKKLDVL